MASDKVYNPQERMPVILTLGDWRRVQQELENSRCYHNCKMHEWLANCYDKKMAGKIAGDHERAAAEAARIYELIEGQVFPQPMKETE